MPVKAIKPREVVLNFSPEQLRAPFLLRCGALIIDYILIVAAPVIGIILSRYFGNNGADLFSSKAYNICLLVGLLLGLTNLVIFPLFSGQSIGKMLTGLRIVKTDGSFASFSRILVRNLIGYPITIVTFGLGFLYSAFNQKGRALHDYIAGTTVIFGRRRIVKKDSV